MVRLKCLLFEETLARVLRACKKINFLFYGCNRCSTGLSYSKADQRLTRVFFFLLLKNVSLDNFLRYFKSVQSSTCWQKQAGSRVRFSTWKEEKPCSPGTREVFMPRASKVSPPSKLKMFTGSVCVLLTSV